MKKVFVVTGSVHSEFTDLLQAFASRQGADAFKQYCESAKKMAHDDYRYYDSFVVNEMEVEA